MHPFLYVFGIAIPVYGLMMVVGGGAAGLLIFVLSKRKNQVERGDAVLTFLIALCGIVIGSASLRPIMRIVEVAINWEQYAAVPAGILLGYVFGEIVFYGGLIGGMAAIVLFCRRYKINRMHMFDLFAPAAALGHGIGRVGCFFGGCCYGIEVPLYHRLAVIYPQASLAAPPGVPLLNMPLIEAAFLGVLSVILSVLYMKTKIPGISVSVYLFAYSTARFIFEFFRGDTVRGQYGLLTTSQYISIGLFVLGVLFFIRAVRKRGKGYV